MGHRLGYILCATPRSGTTLLCDLLAATGVAGRPQSYYRRQDIEGWAGRWGLAPANRGDRQAFDLAYLESVRREGAAGTDVFGLRMMWGTLAEVVERLGPHLSGASGRTLLEAMFGPLVYVHLSRRDKVAQAISLLKAQQSGLWHIAADGSVRQRTAAGSQVGYDAERIAELVDELERDDAGWRAFFAENGIVPVKIDYEALASSPRSALGSVLQALGCSPGAADAVAPTTARMADAESAAWAARFRRSGR